MSAERTYKPGYGKKTVALSDEQYAEIKEVLQNGSNDGKIRANKKVDTILTLEANLGMRLSDIIDLRLSDVIQDGNRYRLYGKIEKKTGKTREFTVPTEVYQYMKSYCYDNDIAKDEPMFNIGERAVQKHLAKVIEYLGYSEPISTHSYRKTFASRIYNDNGCNLMLVQKLLQHSSPLTTQRYICIGSRDMEEALTKNVRL